MIVLGAGVGGLGAALTLARAGHPVTLVERDRTPMPEGPDDAFEWDRRGAPQVRHSHALLARLHNLLRDRYPDVLASLLEAGATEIRFTETLPVAMTDRSARPGDDDLVAIACRRTTFEWVLRRAVLATEGVTLLDGTVAEALVAEPARSGLAADGHRGAPRPVGRSRPGRWTADLVVAALGRRSAVPRLLGQIGAEVTGDSEDIGIVYLSRFYRLAPGAEAPASEGPIGGDLGYLKYAVFLGDNRTFSVTLAVPTDDDELRSLLLDPPTFDRAGRGSARHRGLGRARAGHPHHRGAHHGRAGQPPGRLRARRTTGGGRVPRGGRRPHLHQPALRPRLLAGPGPGHAARRRPRRAPR